MDLYERHPTLPLTLINDAIIDDGGNVIGHLNCGHHYLYVCFYTGKLVVAEHDTFVSPRIELVFNEISDEFFYAFKIICLGQTTAIVDWSGSVELIGVTSGLLSNGQSLWTPATDIAFWPGVASKYEERKNEV